MLKICQDRTLQRQPGSTKQARNETREKVAGMEALNAANKKMYEQWKRAQEGGGGEEEEEEDDDDEEEEEEAEEESKAADKTEL